MTIKPLGDSAWLIELAESVGLAEVLGWVAALEVDRPKGVLDVVASFSSVAVHFSEVDGLEILAWIRAAKVLERAVAVREWEIPVCYGGAEGPDLEEVAKHTGKSVSEVISLHTGSCYTVAALGFSPGFPYLSGLPDCLRVPRKSSPRGAVPAGSVAIAGGQAGIYPNASPAGWQVLGRTTVSLFDPAANPPALMRVGDRVRFSRGELLPPQAVVTVGNAEVEADGWIEVLHPGGMTTVQDLGRPGFEAMGVSPGGAVNRWALQVANRLVGNEPGVAALECCVSGPVLKFHREAVVALMGQVGRPRRVQAGEIVDFSKLPDGVRAYLAVAGGLRVPELLGSAATDVRAGFGGRLLKKGDWLACNESCGSPTLGAWSVGRGGVERAMELRFMRGVQAEWFSDAMRRRFESEMYQVTPQSDRMGCHLSGLGLMLDGSREMVSQPVVCGSVQVPPSGQPIVLMAERQTLGGYPQIGHVISVDLPRLASAWPGTEVRFVEVARDEAVRLRREQGRESSWLETGLKLRF